MANAKKNADMPPNRVYIGPEYDLGIQLHDRPGLLRPAEFNPDEMQAFLKENPQFAEWWANPETTTET